MPHCKFHAICFCGGKTLSTVRTSALKQESGLSGPPARKTQVRPPIVEVGCLLVKEATDQAKIRITTVLIVVARLEFTWATPTFASTAVRPAKNAESKAHVNQFLFIFILERWERLCVVRPRHSAVCQLESGPRCNSFATVGVLDPRSFS